MPIIIGTNYKIIQNALILHNFLIIMAPPNDINTAHNYGAIMNKLLISLMLLTNIAFAFDPVTDQVMIIKAHKVADLVNIEGIYNNEIGLCFVEFSFQKNSYTFVPDLKNHPVVVKREKEIAEALASGRNDLTEERITQARSSGYNLACELYGDYLLDEIRSKNLERIELHTSDGSRILKYVLREKYLSEKIYDLIN